MEKSSKNESIKLKNVADASVWIYAKCFRSYFRSGSAAHQNIIYWECRKALRLCDKKIIFFSDINNEVETWAKPIRGATNIELSALKMDIAEFHVFLFFLCQMQCFSDISSNEKCFLRDTIPSQLFPGVRKRRWNVFRFLSAKWNFLSCINA